jgi:predicted lipid-binding transport protein (Tim44 family)
MAILGGLGAIGGSIACCGLLFVVLLVGLVIWYWSRQPAQQSSAMPPQPPIQSIIEHPTVVGTPTSPPESIAPSAAIPTPPDPSAAPTLPLAPEPPTAPAPMAPEPPAYPDAPPSAEPSATPEPSSSPDTSWSDTSSSDSSSSADV